MRLRHSNTDRGGAAGHADVPSGPGPGKATLTERLWRQASSAGEPAGAPGNRDANGVAPDAGPAVERAASSSGQALPADLRARFEASLGADLSAVRVHTGGASSAAARAVGAKAYTVGSDIHFDDGHYAPGDPAGARLLAHEVAHTQQQQRGAAPARQDALDVSAPGDAGELAADRAADAMISGAAIHDGHAPAAAGSGAPIQRAAIAPVHDETTKGSQGSKIDWSSKAGTFTLAAEKGMEDKSLYEVFLARFKEQLAKLSFKGETYEQIIARRDKLRAGGDLDAARMIDEELWRARAYAILETLKVESSARYKKKVDPKSGNTIDTYCNVYAYDVVCALGAYMPRVWWNEAYLAELEKGTITVVPVAEYRDAQKQATLKGQPATPKSLGKIASIWNETTHELSANMLADWFNRWGAKFKWTRTADMAHAQSQADGGKVVVISASKIDASAGHVSVVIPQDHTVGSKLKAPEATKVDKATKKETPTGQMGAPLQTQAGETNFMYGVGHNAQWWKSPEMRPELETQTDATGATVIDPKTGKAKPVIDAETGAPVDAGHFWIYDGPEQATAVKADAPPAGGDPGTKTAGVPPKP